MQLLDGQVAQRHGDVGGVEAVLRLRDQVGALPLGEVRVAGQVGGPHEARGRRGGLLLEVHELRNLAEVGIVGGRQLFERLLHL